MDNLYNFINNLRAGVAEADRQANNFINQAGQEISNAGKVFVLPFKMAGQQIGQWGQQLAQAMGPNTAQATSNQQTTAQNQTPVQGAAATANNTPVTQGVGTIAGTTPITQGAGQAMINMANAPVNAEKTYYVRDPAIDTFVNTLRFIMNPLRGITGWTPLDVVGDTMSDSMYSAFGQKATPQETKTEETKEEEKKEETKTETEDEGEYVTYTYKPGDTFGQVILDLGLNTGKGLWGTGGDVDYYNKQLLDQGIWSDNQLHNIPIGTTIKLKRRK